MPIDPQAELENAIRLAQISHCAEEECAKCDDAADAWDLAVRIARLVGELRGHDFHLLDRRSCRMQQPGARIGLRCEERDRMLRELEEMSK